MKKNEGWCIVSDARKGGTYGIETLVMVDRRKTEATWWTSDDESVIVVFKDLWAASAACRRIRHNRPRVVPRNEAVQILLEQRERIAQSEIMRVHGPEFSFEEDLMESPK